MKNLTPIALVVLLTPIWFPILLVRIAWNVAEGIHRDLGRWMES